MNIQKTTVSRVMTFLFTGFLLLLPIQELQAACDSSNQKPIAKAGPDLTGEIGVPVSFRDQGSSDPDGNIASWKWTIKDGDMNHIRNYQQSSYTYTRAGTYTVTLAIRDNCNALGTDALTVQIGVVATPTPAQVSAEFSHSPSQPDVLKEVTFSANNVNTDPSIFYLWTFSDGTTSYGPKFSRQFWNGGAYTATLEIYQNMDGGRRTEKLASRQKDIQVVKADRALKPLPTTDYLLAPERVYTVLVPTEEALSGMKSSIGNGGWAMNDLGEKITTVFRDQRYQVTVIGSYGPTFYQPLEPPQFVQFPGFGYSIKQAAIDKAINNQGEVAYTLTKGTVGSNRFYGAQSYFRSPSDGQIRELGNFGGTSNNYAATFVGGMNNHGQVVGRSLDRSSQWWHAFSYDPQNGLQDIHDLVALGRSTTEATDINDLGHIIGTHANSPDSFYYDGKGVFGLEQSYGVPEGYHPSVTSLRARSLNNHGQVVGDIHVTWGEWASVFLFDQKNGVRDLLAMIPPKIRAKFSSYSSGLGYVSKINDRGQIFVTSRNFGTSYLLALAGDFDLSGTVDTAEVAQIQGCLGKAVVASCSGRDLDGDADIDTADFSIAERNAFSE